MNIICPERNLFLGYVVRRVDAQRIWAAYRKNPKYSDARKNCGNYPQIWTMWFHHGVTLPKDADGMANSVDPDQTAPLSENLGQLQGLSSVTSETQFIQSSVSVLSSGFQYMADRSYI